MKLKMITLPFIVAIVLSACTANEKKPTQSTLFATSAQGITDKDRDFLIKAASGGMMEVELGTIAQQNAKDTRVKNFGTMMVRDHTQANNDLKTLAANKNVSIPSSMHGHHQTMVEDTKRKFGADFDRGYINMMVNDHLKDIEDFQIAAKGSDDTDIRAFAMKILPVLQTHLDSARAISGVVRSMGK